MRQKSVPRMRPAIHGVRAAIPRSNLLASCWFATIRERLIKIGARVISIRPAYACGGFGRWGSEIDQTRRTHHSRTHTRNG